MYTVEVELTGIAPLRFNRWVNEEERKIIPQGPRSDATLTSEAELGVYREKDKLYVPSLAVRACIIRGANRLVVGRRGAGNELNAIMFFPANQAKIFLKHDKPFYETGVVRIPPGPKGARVTKRWVCVPVNWKMSFTLEIFEEAFPIEKLEKAINLAGTYAGLLDGRPAYGRFIVSKFKKI